MEGVEEGLPDEADALSRHFEEDSKLMIIPNMKKLFRFLKYIGLDRSPSFSGPKIKIHRISSTRWAHHRKFFADESQTSADHICGDESLPVINPSMKNELAAEEAEAAKTRAEKQADDEKKLAALPRRKPF